MCKKLSDSYTDIKEDDRIKLNFIRNTVRKIKILSDFLD